MTDIATELPAPQHGAIARRLHPGTILVRAPQVLRTLVNALPLFVILVAQGQSRWLAIAALAIAGLGWLGLFLHWSRFTYMLADGEIRIASGIVSRAHRIIPFDRIQDVAIEQGVMARLLGLARVKLETGAAGSHSKEEGELNAIALGEAEMLRDAIRTWRSGTTDASPGAVEDSGDVAEPAPLFAMSLSRIAIAGLFNFSLALFAVLFGILKTFDDILPFDPFDPQTWWQYVDRDSPLVGYLMAHQVMSVLAGLIMIAVIGMVSGVVRTFLREYGFRLDRTETGLRRRRGLLTLTEVTVHRKRIQAGVIVTGIIRKMFGWHALKFQSLATDTQHESDHIMAPLATVAELNGILAEVGLQRSDAGAPGWHRVHPALWRRWAWIALPLALIAVLIAVLGYPRAWLALPILCWWVIARWRAWSHHRFRFDGRQLEITSGWWSPRHLILPAQNIQSIDIAQGPLLRLRGLAAIDLGVAGQSAYSAYRIAAIRLDSAQALRRELLA